MYNLYFMCFVQNGFVIPKDVSNNEIVNARELKTLADRFLNFLEIIKET